MMRVSTTALVLLLLWAAVPVLAEGQMAGAAGGPESDTVRVAPPAGVTEADRASILTALERAEPGATVQFAPGTYLVGELIRVETPRLTLLGHPDGTVLRGCEPEVYDAMERQLVREGASLGPQGGWELLSRCGTFELAGGHVAVRDLTFEMSRHGLVLGCCEGENVLRASAGGYRIEDNTFRNTGNSIRAVLSSPERTVIRGNRFVNTFHAFSGAVSGVHILDNDISVPEPDRVPGTGHSGFAIGISPPLGEAGGSTSPPACEQNVIAGNRIDGHPDGILLSARQPGTSCRENVIRENTIQVRRVRFPVPWLYADLRPLPNPEDSTFVGVPLALSASAAPPDVPEEHNAPARVEDNRVEDNRIVGAEGLGIAISNASRNRVANNTIAGIERREPFPGNMVGWFSTEWREANGSGIWVSPGSDGNMIAGNTLEDIVASAVVLEGDRNQVELQSTDDAVRDMGTGNRVTRAAGGARESDAAVGQAPQAATVQEWTDPSPHELLYVTVSPDVRLEVLDWGGDGLPLVFLAGANFNAHSFDEFAPRFTDTHRVLGITRRGHGASSWPDSGYDLPTLVEDIRVVLDSLDIDRAILAGHSMAGSEMTLLATEFPDRVDGLIYIDAAHDPTDIGRLRVPELCSLSPALLEAIERTFENPELVRQTQRHTGEDGARRPFASAAAVARIDASLPSPDYSGVRAPALGIYYVPERTEDVFMGVGEQPAACVAAFHRYIHGGIAAFTEGVEQATVVALSDTNHNIHLASPDALEAVIRRWLAELREER